MKAALESLSRGIYVVRNTTFLQLILRVLVAVLGVLAAQLAGLWAPSQFAPTLLTLATVGALASALWPTTPLPMATLLLVGGAWFVAGAETAWWQWVALASALAVFHFGCALASVAPAWAATRDVARSFAGAAGRYAAMAVGAALLVAGVGLGFDVPGPEVWVALGAGGLLLVALGLRWWLAREER